MKIISFPEEEVEKIKIHLRENDALHTIKISSEFGNYKKGDFVKSPWGERFVIIDNLQIKGIEHLKKECSHHQELKDTDFEKINKVINYKKVEILKLKKVER
jgi:hypothetical protein